MSNKINVQHFDAIRDQFESLVEKRNWPSLRKFFQEIHDMDLDVENSLINLMDEEDGRAYAAYVRRVEEGYES